MSLTNKYFDEDIKRFPVVENNTEHEAIAFLVLQLIVEPITSQRNFLSYLLIKDKIHIYNKIVELYKDLGEKEFDQISPLC